MDFAEAAGEVEAADIVIINRVICCYPDIPKLAGATADHTREVLVVSLPGTRQSAQNHRRIGKVDAPRVNGR
jgi:hypothetical protein